MSLGWTGAIDRDQYAAGSSDGKLLAVGIGPRIAIWDIAAGRERARYELTPGDSFVAIRFTPDSRYVTVEFSNSRLEIVDLRTGVVRTIPPTATVRRSGDFLAFSADSRFLARNESELGSLQPTRSGSSTPGAWSLPIPAISSMPESCSFTPDGRSLIMVSSERQPSVGTISPAPEPGQPAGHADEAWSLAFSPDGSILASGSDDTDELRADQTLGHFHGQSC